MLVEQELDEQFFIPNTSLVLAQLAVENLLSDFHVTGGLPRHGPGAVAGGERLNEKWKFSTLYESLHSEFPYYDFLFGVRSLSCDKYTKSVKVRPLQLLELVKQYRGLRRESFPISRMAVVPKDSRGPRIISIEPKELMYLQQGVARELMYYIEHHAVTRGHVNFENQEINGSIALSSSSTREYATLDLSDASDRVSLELVKYLFPTRVYKKLAALRSQQVRLPGGVNLPLRKFAAMGSALCFPIESLVFWALAVGTVWKRCGTFRRAASKVYIYGDDIIVADEYALEVMETLERVNLKVNRKKSFHGSVPFRESCGVDGLMGHDVTPLRIRKLPPQRPSDGPAIASYLEYASNALPDYPNRSAALEKLVTKLIGRVPRTKRKEAFLSIVDPIDYWLVTDYPSIRWDPGACALSVRQFCLVSKRTRDDIAPLWRLQNNLVLGTQGDPSLVVARSATQIRKLRKLIIS